MSAAPFNAKLCHCVGPPFYYSHRCNECGEKIAHLAPAIYVGVKRKRHRYKHEVCPSDDAKKGKAEE